MDEITTEVYIKTDRKMLKEDMEKVIELISQIYGDEYTIKFKIHVG